MMVNYEYKSSHFCKIWCIVFISLKFICLAYILHSLSKKNKNLRISCLLLYDSIECVWPYIFFFALKNNSLVHVIYWTLEMLAIFSKLHVCLLVRSVLWFCTQVLFLNYNKSLIANLMHYWVLIICMIL